MKSRSLGRNIVVYGKGGLGGKGDGLVLLEGAMLKLGGKAEIKPVKTVILASELDERFRMNGDKLDVRMEDMLAEILSSFGDMPISVRPSEKGENDPGIATSGENTSFMLPNSHIDKGIRMRQFRKAINLALAQHRSKNPDEAGLAIVINSIDGVHDRTRAGDFYYPLSSLVVDSFFHYPVADKKPEQGFARVAYGHGYATVRADFDVVPILTVMDPEKPSTISRGQRFFYAIDLAKNDVLSGGELETMSLLNISHADPGLTRHFGTERVVNFDSLIIGDLFGYRNGLQEMLGQVSSSLGACQLECTFNIEGDRGVFRIVQFKRMPDPFKNIVHIPDEDGALISTSHVQGHGIWRDVKDLVVIDPFNYTKELHEQVARRLLEINDSLQGAGKRYILISPGRVGTTNLDWGINVDFKHVSGAAAIVEYGYDITGRPEIPMSEREKFGGEFGSHFLYQMLGGAEEDKKVRRLRELGSQGTHFMTNLVTNGAVFLHVNPNKGIFDSERIFSPPEGQESSPIYHRKLDSALTVYADIFSRRCVIR